MPEKFLPPEAQGQEPKEKVEITSQEVIGILKEKGIDNPEAHKKLIDWTVQEEDKAEAQNTPDANIRLSLETGRVLRESGYSEYEISPLLFHFFTQRFRGSFS